jgi:hypothetical protein
MKLASAVFLRLDLALLLVFALFVVRVVAQSPAAAPPNAVDRVFAE